MKYQRQQQAKVLRIFRKVHRITGIYLFMLFFIIAITGLLLGWKKHSGGVLLADTAKGASSDLAIWLPVDSLQQSAFQYLQDTVGADVSLALDRIDIRPEKGIAKFIFADHYWGIQVDCTTGALLQVERRRSDFIENIHDASLLDNMLGTQYGQIKLIYTTLTGLALLTFTITGFWLWYGPKRMRRSNSVTMA